LTRLSNRDPKNFTAPQKNFTCFTGPPRSFHETSRRSATRWRYPIKKI